jgi:hypothetical protein
MLLLLICDTGILSKSLIQHAVISVWNLHRLSYWVFLNQQISFCLLHIRLPRCSMVWLRFQGSIHCTYHDIFMRTKCWRFVDGDIQFRVKTILYTVFVDMATVTRYMKCYHNVTLEVPKIQERNNWSSINTHFRDGAESMPLPPWKLDAANVHQQQP